MEKRTESILQEIEAHRIQGIPRFAGQIHPHYAGYSIANLPASICNWLGCPPPADLPLAPDYTASLAKSYRHVILIVVDGLGWEFLRSLQTDERSSADWEALQRDSLLLPLTSIVPSTTSAALTTFWTGRQPAEHGIIGYEMFLKEYGFIANIILQSVSSFIGDSGNLIKAGFDRPLSCGRNPRQAFPLARHPALHAATAGHQ
jgi:hypothetical protein